MARDEHSSKTHPPLKDKPGKNNWVENNAVRDKLPSYIRRIAKHLVSDQGFSLSRAIATAVNTVRKWATGYNHNGSKVSAKTQAEAAKAIAQWEAMAASSKGKDVKNLTRRFFDWLGEPVGGSPVDLARKDKKKDDKTEWAHGFIPKTPKAAKIKDHRAKGSASDGGTPVKGTKDYEELSAKQQREVDAATAKKKSQDSPKDKDTSKFSGKAETADDAAKKKTVYGGNRETERDSKSTVSRIPQSVWRGRAQRLASLSPEALKRSLASKSDDELAALRKAVGTINDQNHDTDADAGKSFSGIIGLIDAEKKKREKGQ